MIAIVVPQCLITTLFHTVEDPIRIDIIWFLEQVPTDHSRKIDYIVFIIRIIGKSGYGTAFASSSVLVELISIRTQEKYNE